MSFTESEIRPYEFESGKLAALEQDLEWLRSRRSKFIQVSCPACDRSNSEPAFEKFGFTFVSCRECRTVYMNPRAAPELLIEFYSGSVLYEYWNKYIFPASRKVRQEKIFRPRIERLIELCQSLGIKPETIIDAGAANGAFCEEALKSSAFKRVIAIEPSRAQAQTCRDYGIETVERSLEGTEGLDSAADILTSFETIEHVFSPREFIAQCVRFLRPNGLLALTCPNYEGFDIQTLGVQSESLDAEHINLFNPDSLQHLVEGLGFKVVECLTPGKLDAELVRRKALDGDVDLGAHHFLRTVLIDKWATMGEPFQKFLRDHRLSSHMWLVAQRKP